jgi:hypothetical protein
MKRLVARSLAAGLIAVGFIALSGPVWADGATDSPTEVPTAHVTLTAVASARSEDEVAVPDVTGLPVQQASDTIEAADLTMTAGTLTHGGSPGEPAPNEVAACQIPSGGTMVRPSTNVFVLFDDADRFRRLSQLPSPYHPMPGT